jgi:hypothetical protein
LAPDARPERWHHERLTAEFLGLPEAVACGVPDALLARLAVPGVGHRGRVDDVLRVEVVGVGHGNLAEVDGPLRDGLLVDLRSRAPAQRASDPRAHLQARAGGVDERVR